MQRIESMLSAGFERSSSWEGYCPALPLGKKPETISGIVMEEAAFRMKKSSDLKPILSDVSLHVPRGSMTVVVGPVGSGKSLLLSALAGEMDLVAGHLELAERIAYVPQLPWIMSGSVRDNILMGKVFDEARFLHAMQACALDKEFSFTRGGDLSDVGPQGSKLSVGQRCR